VALAAAFPPPVRSAPAVYFAISVVLSFIAGPGLPASSAAARLLSLFAKRSSCWQSQLAGASTLRIIVRHLIPLRSRATSKRQVRPWRSRGMILAETALTFLCTAIRSATVRSLCTLLCQYGQKHPDPAHAPWLLAPVARHRHRGLAFNFWRRAARRNRSILVVLTS